MKKKRIILVIIGALILGAISLLIVEVINKIPNNNKEIVVIETIDKYNYSLEERDNKIYQEEFKILKNILSKDKIDYDAYAKSVAKLFIIDFYTLNNKVTKYDVGGLDFLLKDSIPNFKIKAMDTIYKYIKDNLDGKREQELPTVKTIKVTDFTKSTFKVKEVEYESYVVQLSWEYTKDNEYDKSAKITLINTANKLFVVEESRI